MSRIPCLDGLRAIAVLLVISEHLRYDSIAGDYLKWLPFDGRTGVALFFVLSGFLITLLLLDERARRGSIDLRRFYLRRSLRILPAYYVFLVVIAGLAAARLVSTTWQDLGTAALLVTNLHPDSEGWTLAHTWTLAIEAQFYILCPLLLIALHRFIPLLNTRGVLSSKFSLLSPARTPEHPGNASQTQTPDPTTHNSQLTSHNPYAFLLCFVAIAVAWILFHLIRHGLPQPGTGLTFLRYTGWQTICIGVLLGFLYQRKGLEEANRQLGNSETGAHEVGVAQLPGCPIASRVPVTPSLRHSITPSLRHSATPPSAFRIPNSALLTCAATAALLGLYLSAHALPRLLLPALPILRDLCLAALLWSLLLDPEQALGRFLEWRPVAFIGLISYSLYLWQQPFLKSEIFWITEWHLQVTMIVVTALLSYVLIEKPISGIRSRLKPN